MKPLKVEERRLVTSAGTDIAYHVVGEGLPVLLCNGLGGSWRAWSHQIDHLQDRYRFVSWDYRGLHGSRMPRDPAAIEVADHAADAAEVMNAERLDRAAVLGWSMGVQVALELFRHAPDRFAAMMLLNGVAGRPWNSVVSLPSLRHLIPRLVRAAGHAPRLTEAVTRRVVQWPEAVQWAKRIGLAGRTLDEDTFQELAESFVELDMRVYMRILDALGRHDAHDVLADVDVPTLVVAGDRDPFTPRSAAERMAREIPGAEIMVVPGGTHYVAVEHPELVNLRLEMFFRERGYAPGAS